MKKQSVKKVAQWLGSGVAVSVLVAACGGGGGGTTASGLSVSGDVVKGPMANARISLYKTTADGQKGALLAQTTSDANGHYSVTVQGYSGVVIAEATVIAGTTKMYDEATGTTVDPAPAFALRASFPAEDGKQYSTQINPFTELATHTALAKSGGLSATNVEQANKDLAESLTFNPLTTAPDFGADKSPRNAAALALAALSKMAAAGDLGCTSGTQAAKVACVTAQLDSRGVGEAGLRSALQSHMDALADTVGLPTVALSTPSGATVTLASSVEQAKAFFGTLRSNAAALDADELSLKTALNDVGNDLRSRSAPLAKSTTDTLQIALMGARFWRNVMQTPGAAFTTTQTLYDGSANLGSCGLYSDSNYRVLATSKTDAKYVACATYAQIVQASTATGEYKPCTAVGDLCYTAWSQRVRLHPSAASANQFTVYTQTRAARYTLQANNLPGETAITDSNGTTYPNRTHYGASFPGNPALLTLALDSNTNYGSVDLSGDLSPAFRISGGSGYYDTAQQRYVSIQPTVTVLGDKHQVAMAASLAQTDAGIDRLALGGSIALIKSGALESKIEIDPGSYLQAKADANGSYQSVNGSQEILLVLKASSAQSALAGSVKMSDFQRDASGTQFRPTVVTFTGSVQRFNTATNAYVSFLEGSIKAEELNYASYNQTLPYSGTNQHTARMTLTGQVAIPTRPLLTVRLSGTETDNAVKSGTFSGQFHQGSITINLAGNYSPVSNLQTLESTDGIKLAIDKSKTVYPLTKNGYTVGSYSTLTHRLTYADNTYEQF